MVSDRIVATIIADKDGNAQQVAGLQREVDTLVRRRVRDMQAQLYGGVGVGAVIGAVAFRFGGWGAVAGLFVLCSIASYRWATR